MSLIEQALNKKQDQEKKQAVPTPLSPASEHLTTSQQVDSTAAVFDTAPSAHVQPTQPGPLASPNAVLELSPAFLQQRGIITQDTRRTQLKEEFRFIKRKVLQHAFHVPSGSAHPNLVMVTSANPKEGKTFNAINLAMSVIQEQEKTALLIDADVLQPNVCHTLGLDEPSTGLVDYLLDDNKTVADVLFSTNIPRFTLLPSGIHHHLTSELIASQRMANLVNELAQRYPDRLVIFDSPPLLGINETQILASLVGQIIVVVEEDKTSHRDIKMALSLLEPDKQICCVMNKTSQKRSAYIRYGQHYDQ